MPNSRQTNKHLLPPQDLDPGEIHTLIHRCKAHSEYMSQRQKTGREDFLYLGAEKPSQNCLPLFQVLQDELEFFRGGGDWGGVKNVLHRGTEA